MDILREIIDNSYNIIKPLIFNNTAKNPEKAHEIFLKYCKFIHKHKLSKLLLNHKHNFSSLQISNAAGFNKNGDLPPQVLRYFGFSRIVVGTVTNDSWSGNPGVTIKRYPRSESMVNWMGLPGIGASKVAKNLARFGKHNVLITINFMSTPKKQGDDVLEDLKGTILATRGLHKVDRFELNISCPNTHSSSGGLDARKENLKQLNKMLKVCEENVLFNQDIYLKVSPDSTDNDVDDILNVCKNFKIKGFVVGNTTTKHNDRFIKNSPGLGGASGNAVYADSFRVQQLFHEKIKKLGLNYELIACGGINSVKKLKERLGSANEIQIFTPFIYSGPKLIREFRRK